MIINSFYYNRKYENRKKFFLNFDIEKSKSQAEKVFNNKFSDVKYEEYLTRLKEVLSENNLIVKILEEMSNKENIVNKKKLYSLIIPLKTRLYLDESNIHENYLFYKKNLYRREKDELIKTFLDQLFIPKKFLKVSPVYYDNLIHYKNFLKKFNNIVIEIYDKPENFKARDDDYLKETNNHKAISYFIAKYYIQKIKNFDNDKKKVEDNKKEIIIN